jgi:uncharacterized tellurite resistance protein B-like protein
MLPRKFCKIRAILNFSLQGFTLTFASDEYVSCGCLCHMSPFRLSVNGTHYRGFCGTIGRKFQTRRKIDLARSLTPETQYDVACLLAIAARSDGSIATQETERLVSVLQRGFALKESTALQLMVRALEDVPDTRDISTFLKNLELTLDRKQTENLIVMLLEVVAADGVKDAREISVLDQAITALKVSDASMDRAYRSYFAQRQSAST